MAYLQSKSAKSVVSTILLSARHIESQAANRLDGQSVSAFIGGYSPICVYAYVYVYAYVCVYVCICVYAYVKISTIYHQTKSELIHQQGHQSKEAS